ncbi:MAG: glycolate oxidase subunit GlcF, partial [Proteobacteria bacterium]|nr:glycolate oxidase subunit GlcF [Pseudomonadota bacterium]
GLTSPLFAPAMKLGQMVRPWLPQALKNKVPAPAPKDARGWPAREHARKMLLLAGCVQPAMMPNVNRATAHVLDAAGIQTVVARGAGCCGALRTHLNDHAGGLADMRRNIDAWWPMVEAGQVEAIVMNASGCGVMVKEYRQALAHDPQYAERAARVSELTRDLSELLPELAPALRDRVHVSEAARRLAFHPPCTLQHGQQLRGTVETGLRALGFEVTLPAESHLCCGSAGTYSVLLPELAYRLRDRKLGHLAALQSQCIVSANIGCIQHLQTGTDTPVRHWVEVLDDALETKDTAGA